MKWLAQFALALFAVAASAQNTVFLDCNWNGSADCATGKVRYERANGSLTDSPDGTYTSYDSGKGYNGSSRAVKIFQTKGWTIPGSGVGFERVMWQSGTAAWNSQALPTNLTLSNPDVWIATAYYVQSGARSPFTDPTGGNGAVGWFKLELTGSGTSWTGVIPLDSYPGQTISIDPAGGANAAPLRVKVDSIVGYAQTNGTITGTGVTSGSWDTSGNLTFNLASTPTGIPTAYYTLGNDQWKLFSARTNVYDGGCSGTCRGWTTNGIGSGFGSSNPNGSEYRMIEGTPGNDSYANSNKGSGMAFPKDAWTCEEMHYHYDVVSGGTAEMYLNGSLRNTMGPSLNMGSPNAGDKFDLGVGNYTAEGNQFDSDLWVGLVRIANYRTGCGSLTSGVASPATTLPACTASASGVMTGGPCRSGVVLAP